MPPTCISSWRARRAGRWRTASSRRAAPASSRAWACARWPARRPASPIPMRSCCRRSKRRRAPRAPSPTRGQERAAHGVLPTERPQALSAHRSGVELHLQREGRVAGARRSRDPQDGSARGAGHGQRGRRARSGAGGQQRRHTWRPTCGRWCASTSRSSSNRMGGASRATRARAGASRCRSWSKATGRWRWRAKPCARHW